MHRVPFRGATASGITEDGRRKHANGRSGNRAAVCVLGQTARACQTALRAELDKPTILAGGKSGGKSGGESGRLFALARQGSVLSAHKARDLVNGYSALNFSHCCLYLRNAPSISCRAFLAPFGSYASIIRAFSA